MRYILAISWSSSLDFHEHPRIDLYRTDDLTEAQDAVELHRGGRCDSSYHYEIFDLESSEEVPTVAEMVSCERADWAE